MHDCEITKGTLIESAFEGNLLLKQNNVTTDSITGHMVYLSDIRDCNYSIRQTCIFILKRR